MSKLAITHVPIGALRPSPFNVNIVSPDNETKIDNSIERLGLFKPALCRELDDGSLELIGGEHRWLSAKRKGEKEFPIINLGRVSDARAKEIGLVDNARYGTDDTLQLAELFDGMEVDDLSSFTPFSDSDITSIFSSVNIELDNLDIEESDERPGVPQERPLQTHQIMRFRIPVEDSWIQKLLEETMKTQKMNESDSLTNAGDALIYLLTKLKAYQDAA